VFVKMSKRVTKPFTKAKEASSSLAKSIAKKSKSVNKGKETIVNEAPPMQEAFDSTKFCNRTCQKWYSAHKIKPSVMEKDYCS